MVRYGQEQDWKVHRRRTNSLGLFGFERSLDDEFNRSRSGLVAAASLRFR